jgi:hypothetical protein
VKDQVSRIHKTTGKSLLLCTLIFTLLDGKITEEIKSKDGKTKENWQKEKRKAKTSYDFADPYS